MSNLALYRKYRSTTFTQVVGQEHVVKTLTSAIANGRISHAYLFTGPRGVGKTSVARLLARALNCTGSTKPCNACALCQAAINSSLDIVEIDAASNRSIDSIRDLREKIALAPSIGKYKIYIIDEVHMLTAEAFNALLKTLEEPPAHAVFVLATTEAHKIPETIVSRTQSFSFKPISDSDITTQLRRIAAAEKIAIDDEALGTIATFSRGGFRDAISILDQLASSGITPITAATVRTLIGYSAAEEITALSHAILAHDAKAALVTLSQLTAAGAQAGQIATQLADQWRSVMGAAAGIPATDPAISDLTAHTNARAAAAVVAQLVDIMRSPWPQLSLETTLVKLCSDGLHTASKRALPTPQAAPAPRPTPAAPAPVPTAVPTAAPAAGTAPQTPTLNPSLWPKVLVILKSKNNSLCALLQMYPIDFGDGEVTIKPRFNFHRDLFLKPANRSSIEEAAAKVYGQPVKVRAKTEDTGVKARRTKPDPAAELVSSALEILGGEIVE